MTRKKFLAVLLFTCFTSLTCSRTLQAQSDERAVGKKTAGGFELTREHIKAINRPRKTIVNYDNTGGSEALVAGGQRREWTLKAGFAFADMEGSQIDSIFWCFGTGNDAVFPSKVRPLSVDRFPKLKDWIEAGVDRIQIYLDETKKRDLEAFYSYRINGVTLCAEGWYTTPMHKAHPDWLIRAWPPEGHGFWNFAIPGVREYKLSILREVAEKYDFDGIDVDFARQPLCLPTGHQWENRAKLTDFMRSVRAMLLEVEKKRGRPFLLSARVPENIEGCHFDGMDVEAWAREELVDIFVLGCRALDVDIEAFRRITTGTNIKLYPCFDDWHSSDGYRFPPIEVFRGVAANWWQQRPDGVCTFNFQSTTPELTARAGLPKPFPVWAAHQQAYLEIGSPETLKHKDKTFVVERRGGGHPMIAKPEHWSTPRWMYFNTNMFAPLPARLANDGKADTLLFVRVGDDVAAEADRIEQITVRVLLSDPTAKDLPEEKRLKPVTVATKYRQLKNLPPAKGIEEQVELRVNNILLPCSAVEAGWLVFPAQPNQFAVGKNLIGVRVVKRPPDVEDEISIEKLEVHVKYR